MSAIPVLPGSSSYDKAYTVVISGKDELGTPIGYNNTGTIVAALPEQFDLSVAAHFAPIFTSPGIGGLTGGALGTGLASKALSAGGYTDQLPLFSQMYWTHSEPISFTLNLQFNAVYDAKAEVMGNIASLTSLCLPSLTSAGFFRAPGPALLTKLSGNQYEINMTIGKAWLFSNVLIYSVHSTVDTMPDKNGDYVSANVQLGVMLNRVYSKQDMADAFGNKSQTQPTDPLSAVLGSFPSSADAASSFHGALNGLGRDLGIGGLI